MKQLSIVLAFMMLAIAGTAQTTADSCKVYAEAYSKANPPTPNMSRQLTARQIADYMIAISRFGGFSAATFNWNQCTPQVAEQLRNPPYNFSWSQAGWDYQLYHTFSFRPNVYSN